MGLVLHTNSWVTVAEADTYLADKYGASAWSPLPNTTKEQLLITAFRWIFYYSGVSIPASSTDSAVKAAQIELAWWIYNYWSEYEKRQALIAGGVKEFTLSKWREKLSKQDIPQNILNMLPLVNTGGYFQTMTRELDND